MKLHKYNAELIFGRYSEQKGVHYIYEQKLLSDFHMKLLSD